MFNARPVLTSNISHPIEQKSGSHITRLSITNNSSDHSIDMSDDDDVVLPKPPTSNLMINRLTSIIDESLTNIQYLVHDIELKRRDSQKQLDNVHKTLRNLIDKKQKQYESDINEYFKKHNENILKSETYLKQLKFQLLDLCCDFNINNYKYIEQLTKTTIEKVFIEPNICNKLTDADKFLDLTWQCYIAKNDGQQEQEQEQTNCKEENLISNNRTNNHHYVLSGVKEEDESKSQSFSPVKTTSSIETSTGPDRDAEYDYVCDSEVKRNPLNCSSQYRLSYQNAVRLSSRSDYTDSFDISYQINQWSYELEYGNYFISLITPYRSDSVLLYCLDKEQFICYCTSSVDEIATIEWRGTRPYSIYWCNEVEILFVACKTYIYACNLNFFDDKYYHNRILCRIPIDNGYSHSDSSGEQCYPRYLTSLSNSRLLYAYWKTKYETILVYYRTQDWTISCQHFIEGRCRALCSTDDDKLGLLIERANDYNEYVLEVYTQEFQLLSKIELNNASYRFSKGCCLTASHQSTFLLTDWKLQQLWKVNLDGTIQIKQYNEPVYNAVWLKQELLLILLIGNPIRFEFYKMNLTNVDDEKYICEQAIEHFFINLFPDMESFEM